jgi:DNA-binding transcriptional LysR family regulator
MPAMKNQERNVFMAKVKVVHIMKAPFDSRQLRAFVTLARTGSFTVAAKELFLSQSAVSHSIKALEEETRCRLLDRVGKRVAVTPAGEQLLHHAEKILKEMEAARMSMSQLRNWGHARLRLAASATACQYILPKVLREFQPKYPQHLISIQPGDTPEAMQQLRENKIDMAYCLQPRHAEDFHFVPLFTDELLFIVSPSHAWGTNGQVVREEIPQQRYILYSKNSFTFRLVESYFHAEKLTFDTVIEVGSMEATKELVKVGLGVSILAPWIVEQELQDGSLISLPLGKRKLKRTWGILYRRERVLNLAEQTFVELCRETEISPLVTAVK